MDQREGIQKKNSEYEALHNTIIVNERFNPYKLIIPHILIILIISIISVYAYMQKKTIIDNVEQVSNQTAEYIAGNIANEMNYAQSSIKFASSSISQSMTSPVLQDPANIIMPMLDNTPFGAIEYIRADGMNVMNIGEAFDASDRFYYIDGMKGNSGIWNNLHPKKSSETLMNFYTPVIYEEEIVGVLTGYIAATSQINPLFETKLFGQDIVGMLIDENNMVICTTIDIEYKKDLSLCELMDNFGVPEDQKLQVYSTINSAKDYAVSYKDALGDGRVSITKIPGSDWKVVIVIPESSFNAIINRNTRDSIIVISLISLILISYAASVLIRNVQRRREIAEKNVSLEEEKNDYYNTLGTLAGIYNSVHVINLIEDSVIEFSASKEVRAFVNRKDGACEMMLQVMTALSTDEYREKALEYTNLKTLADRMQNKKYIANQLKGKNIGWFIASFITMETDQDGRPTKVIYTTQSIDETKRQEERLINKSRTDELTGLLNRRAYEEDIYEQNVVPDKKHFVSMSLDVNGLKVVNDNLGHAAGDELLKGASQCMKESLGPYGKLYRTGGDEFIGILFLDNTEIKPILEKFDERIASWKGKLIDSLSISYGFVSNDEEPQKSVRELAALADKRMYESKSEYYRKKGVDRRGYQEAHTALSQLYTKILKINISNDTYQIVNMDAAEMSGEKAFTDKISTWLTSFASSGHVHPDDLQEYKSKTDLQFLRDYFASNNSLLRIFYRRKYGKDFKKVMMEIIPAKDYSEYNQTLYLYVQQIDK